MEDKAWERLKRIEPKYADKEIIRVDNFDKLKDEDSRTNDDGKGEAGSSDGSNKRAVGTTAKVSDNKKTVQGRGRPKGSNKTSKQTSKQTASQKGGQK